MCGYWGLRVNVREREKIEKDQDLKCEIKAHWLLHVHKFCRALNFLHKF